MKEDDVVIDASDRDRVMALERAREIDRAVASILGGDDTATSMEKLLAAEVSRQRKVIESIAAASYRQGLKHGELMAEDYGPRIDDAKLVDLMAAHNPEAHLPPGLAYAFVGVGLKKGSRPVAVYSTRRILAKMVESGRSREEAILDMDATLVEVDHGDSSPVFIDDETWTDPELMFVR